jgi:hypothetical protein
MNSPTDRIERTRRRARARRNAKASGWMAVLALIAGGGAWIGIRSAGDTHAPDDLRRAHVGDAALAILPSPAFTHNELSVANASASAHVPRARIVWSVNGRDVGEGKSLSPDRFRRGDVVTARIETSANADFLDETPRATTTILNAPPRIEAVRIVRDPGAPHRVFARVETSDPDGDAITTRVTWEVDGEVVVAPDGDALSVAELRRGRSIVVEVIADDGTSSVRGKSVPFVVEDRAPRLSFADAPELHTDDHGVRHAMLPVRAEDPETGGVVIELVDAPSGVSFDPTSGHLVWEMSDGSERFHVVVRATTDRGSTSERTITLRR